MAISCIYFVDAMNLDRFFLVLNFCTVVLACHNWSIRSAFLSIFYILFLFHYSMSPSLTFLLCHWRIYLILQPYSKCWKNNKFTVRLDCTYFPISLSIERIEAMQRCSISSHNQGEVSRNKQDEKWTRTKIPLHVQSVCVCVCLCE